MKITFLFGLLCLTPASVVSRRLMSSKSAAAADTTGAATADEKNQKDQYYDELYGGDVDVDIDVDLDVDGDQQGGENDLISAETDPIAVGEGNSNRPITDKNGSMDYGYVETKMLWTNNGPYECQSILETFWLDVQESVFVTCDSKWSATSMWASYSKDCKIGARQFVQDEMNKCFDVEECSQVGVSAAASVAGTFCKQNGLYHERAAWIPAKCVQHALVSCKYDAVESVQKFNQGGVCASGSALDHVDEIYQLCEQEVDAMEQAAKLNDY